MMVEEQVSFLCSVASKLTNDDETQTLLKSYYLMRCKDISRGFGLPDQHFSANRRCPNCCTAWNHSINSTLRPSKLSKRQRRRRRISTKKSEGNAQRFSWNQLESVCEFCKHKTVTPLIKPDKDLGETSEKTCSSKTTHQKSTKCKKSMPMQECKKIKLMDAYSNSNDIFSFHNENNLIRKEQPKIIKNCKKKKDKFAGLCQQAVLSAAKQKKDKLSLFLKPSL